VSLCVCLFVCLFVLFVEIIIRSRDKIGKLSFLLGLRTFHRTKP